ncbi:MAG: hypothetical protein V4662_00690 [Verrucomicrobiota bacterium]
MKASYALNPSSQPALPVVVNALRANERLIVALALLAGLPFTLAVVGMIMRACGASLKPDVFVVGVAASSIIAVIALFVARWVRARLQIRHEEPGVGLGTHLGQFSDRERVFGTDVPAFLIRNAKPGMPGVLDEAEVAESGVTIHVESVLVAQFHGSKEARKAVAAYQRTFMLQNITGDEVQGWKARRSLQGDYVEMLCRGRVLFVWACLSPDACAERRLQTQVESLLPDTVAEEPSIFPMLQSLAVRLRLLKVS